MRLARSSEPYSDYGNVSGQGARRLLGAPAADPLLTAIRESVQNSWDARLGSSSPRYSVRLRTLSPAQRDVLREKVFGDLSGDPASPLRDVLQRQKIVVMEIADFGTWGLTGPVRPSQVTKGQKSRFVSLMRNIGAPREEHSVSGGTYGYGKSSLFMVSQCQSVVVDSLAMDGHGNLERRFMASRMGEEFFENGRAHTGRHWWGVACEADTVDPAVGEEAIALANGLGMPDRENSSGTTILVLDPDLSGDEDQNPIEQALHRAGNRIVKTLLWYFWPKMVATESRATPMEFSVAVEDESITVPHPDEAPPFQILAEALRKMHVDPSSCYAIASQRPQRHLGYLAYCKDFREARDERFTEETDPEIPDPLHHIALMRPAELVVRYVSGNPLPDERFEWGGLFICSAEEEVENAFAAAEPPTHDDWNPEHLPGGSWAKRYVRIGLRRIDEVMKEIAPAVIGPEGGGAEGLAGAADDLGKLLMPGDGDRAVHPRGGKGGRGGKVRTVRLNSAAFERLRQDRKGVAAVFSFVLTGPEGATTVLESTPRILADGTDRLAMSPEGVEPTVLQWTIEGQNGGEDSRVNVEFRQTTVSGQVVVRVPGGMVVDPAIRVVEQDEN